MNRPAQPTGPTPGPDPAQLAAYEAQYKEQRDKFVTAAAGLLLLADVIGQGLPKKGAAAFETSSARLEMAFDVAEAYIAAAEKRLGGKIDLDD